MEATDPILVKMATDLKEALVEHGLDPEHPPEETRPPAKRAFAEYKRRGGTVYNSPGLFVRELVEEVVRQAKQDKRDAMRRNRAIGDEYTRLTDK